MERNEDRHVEPIYAIHEVLPATTVRKAGLVVRQERLRMIHAAEIRAQKIQERPFNPITPVQQVQPTAGIKKIEPAVRRIRKASPKAAEFVERGAGNLEKGTLKEPEEGPASGSGNGDLDLLA